MEKLSGGWFAGKYVVNSDGCWLWTGSVGTDGYGSVTVGSRENHATVRVHRAAYEAFVRPIPPHHPSLGHHGWCVCHVCDVRLCINPDHLFLAPQAVNLRDASRKGRFSAKSRLSDEQVTAIKAAYASGKTQRELSVEYGLSQPYISRLLTGERRAHHDAPLGTGIR